MLVAIANDLFCTPVCVCGCFGGLPPGTGTVEPSPETIYVDALAQGPGVGSAASPYNTLTFAVEAAPAGSRIVMKAWFYAENLVIKKPLTLAASREPVIVGGPTDRLWAGVNNGDIYDEPDVADDPDKTLGAMLDVLVTANLRVIRIWIDYRLELDDEGDALPLQRRKHSLDVWLQMYMCNLKKCLVS